MQRKIFLVSYGVRFLLLLLLVPLRAQEDGTVSTSLSKTIDSHLLQAVTQGDVPGVTQALQNGANVNTTDEHGETVLRYALMNKLYPIVEILVKQGAVLLTEKRSISCLEFACWIGDLKMVQRILETGVRCKDRLAVWYAAKSYHDEVVEYLLSIGMRVNSPYKGYGHPLVVASDLGSIELIQMLLQAQAEVNVQDRDGKTALHNAAKCGRYDLIPLLLSCGASVNLRDRNNLTVLHNAVSSGKEKAVEQILQAGSKLNVQTGDTFSTPLHYAVAGDNVAIVSSLVRAGAVLDIRDGDGYTPLVRAVAAGKKEMAHILFSAGADPCIRNDVLEKVKLTDAEIDLDDKAVSVINPRVDACEGSPKKIKELLESEIDIDGQDREGKTMLHQLIEWNHSDEALRLLNRGASVNIRDYRNRNALYFAVRRGSLKLVMAVLEKKAELNIQDYEKFYTPLHIAVRCRGYFFVRALVKAGALLDLRDIDGKTPLHSAAEKGKRGIPQFLITAGAVSTFEDRSGDTPWILAANESHVDILKILLEHKEALESVVQYRDRLFAKVYMGRQIIRKYPEKPLADFKKKRNQDTMNCIMRHLYLLFPAHWVEVEESREFLRTVKLVFARYQRQSNSLMNLNAKYVHLEIFKKYPELIKHLVHVFIDELAQGHPIKDPLFLNVKDETVNYLYVRWSRHSFNKSKGGNRFLGTLVMHDFYSKNIEQMKKLIHEGINERIDQSNK